MNNESVMGPSLEAARLTAVKVELDGYLREKIKFSRDSVILIIKATEVVRV